jgi:hypothetical protein
VNRARKYAASLRKSIRVDGTSPGRGSSDSSVAFRLARSDARVLAISFCGSRIFPGILLDVTTTASPVGALEIQFVVSISPSGAFVVCTCFVNSP